MLSKTVENYSKLINIVLQFQSKQFFYSFSYMNSKYFYVLSWQRPFLEIQEGFFGGPRFVYNQIQ